jgi:ATP adenylyltransferase
MKRDRDDTDFRAVRAAYHDVRPDCPFCSIDDREVSLQNNLAVVAKDKYPVSEGHLLIVPKRHTADYFDLGTAEVRACQQLLTEARARLLKGDPTILGFNVGINNGKAAGQTVMHCHVHLIPRRVGSNPTAGSSWYG